MPYSKQQLGQRFQEIKGIARSLNTFAAQVHNDSLRGSARPFKNLLLIGIGESVLDPQYVANASGNRNRDKLTPYLFDNTDPDRIDNTLSLVQSDLGETLGIVVSKSGDTKERSNIS